MMLICTWACLHVNTARAQMNNWPLTPTNVIHPIWTGYGQYEHNGDNFYHHEALDLIGDSGQIVVAIEDGRIVERNATGRQNGRMTITRGDDTTKGILYMHINIAKFKRDTTRRWIVGDTVAKGDTIGYILTYNRNLHAHTHVEWVNKEHPNSWDPTGDGNPEPDKHGNLIDLLHPTADAYPPAIFRPVRYRDAAGEGNDAIIYFDKSTACGDTVIKGNTDIVARARDQFALYGALNFDNAVKRMQFSIYQYTPGTGTQIVPLTSPFTYAGKLLAAAVGPNAGEVNRNTFDKMRNETLAWVDYENDNTCRSVTQAGNGTSNTGVYYYIPTNKNENDSIQEVDANRYWDTNGKSGEAWNDSNETAVTHEADSNKNAAFPDGRYIVRLKVTGYGSNASDTAVLNDTIFVNNFNEFIYSCDTLGRDKDTFCTGEPVFIKGKGYPQNRSFRAFVIKDTTWTNGMAMLGGAYRVAAITVTTDNNGRFGPVKIWNAYAVNGTPDKGYDILLDYDGDSLYTDTVQGLGRSVDTKDENLPGRKGIIGAEPMKVKITARDVRCYGDSNGCVTVSITGGKKPYKIRIRGTGLDTTITDSVWCRLKAGKYLVTVTGKDSCQVTNDSVEIKQPAKMSMTKSVTNATCMGGCDGSAMVMVTGGTPPYMYWWSGGTGSGPFRSNLCPGTYLVTVIDSNGCMITDTVQITGSAPLMITGTVTPDSCNTGKGSISISIMGGTAPYTCSWGGSGSCSGLSNLYTGYYMVTVKDSSGCSASAFFFVPDFCNNPKDTSKYGDTLRSPFDATGIGNISPENGAYVYPNPATNTLNVAIGRTAGFTVELADMLGNVVYRHTYPAGSGSGTVSIDLGRMAEGMYIYTITPDHTAKVSGRLLISR